MIERNLRRLKSFLVVLQWKQDRLPQCTWLSICLFHNQPAQAVKDNQNISLFPFALFKEAIRYINSHCLLTFVTPQFSPSISTDLTALVSSVISVSSSHGLTSSNFDVFARRAGFFYFFSAYALSRSSLTLAAAASSSSPLEPKRSTSSSSLSSAATAPARVILLLYIYFSKMV